MRYTRAYLVELFEAGKANRNHRVNPEEAELKIRNQFPTKEESWLTVKQVMIISQFNYIEEYQYHSDKKFVQPSGYPERSEKTDDELVLAYDNAEAEKVLSDTNKEAMKMARKKKK